MTATQWCALGALDAPRTLHGTPHAIIHAAAAMLDTWATTRFRLTLIDVNDTLGHAHVLAVYDAALAALEEKNHV